MFFVHCPRSNKPETKLNIYLAVKVPSCGVWRQNLMKGKSEQEANDSPSCFPAPPQPPHIPGLADQLGADDLGNVAHRVPAAAGDAGLRDQSEVQQRVRAADRAGRPRPPLHHQKCTLIKEAHAFTVCSYRVLLLTTVLGWKVRYLTLQHIFFEDFYYCSNQAKAEVITVMFL